MTTIQRSSTVVGLGLAAMFVGLSAAAAQDRDIPEITVRPSGPGEPGYYGAYGRDLPGVYLLDEAGVLPGYDFGDVLTPQNYIIVNRYTYDNPLPTLDAWHGTQGPGFIQF